LPYNSGYAGAELWSIFTTELRLALKSLSVTIADGVYLYLEASN
jgi:hypothetical protein